LAEPPKIDTMALSDRGQRVLAVARRIVELERELGDLHRDLESELEPRGGPIEPRRPAEGALSPGPLATEDIQGSVLQHLRARPGQSFKAGDLKAALGGRPAKGSVESALQRLFDRGEIKRIGRGSYAASTERSQD
jgi:hypothetical protein